MKIYVTHSTSYDYHKELYLPLRQSPLDNLHDIVLPHEDGPEINDSKSIISNSDLVIAVRVNAGTQPIVWDKHPNAYLTGTPAIYSLEMT